jgi:hypothetical protein
VTIGKELGGFTKNEDEALRGKETPNIRALNIEYDCRKTA